MPVTTRSKSKRFGFLSRSTPKEGASSLSLNSPEEFDSEGEVECDEKEAEAFYKSMVEAVNSLSAASASAKGSIAFPTFRGEDNEDVREFLVNFERSAFLCGWTDERKALGLPLYLKDGALVWFNSLNTEEMDYEAMIEALEKQFSSETNIWQMRQKLIERKQLDNEPLSSYTKDIRKMCMSLDLPKQEWVYYFIQGLKPNLRSHVVLQKPTDFDAAVDAARLKESVEPLNSSTNASAKEIGQAVTEQLKKLFVSNRPTVAAYSPLRPNIPGEKQQGEDMRKMIREEIQKALPRRENNRQNDNYRSQRTGRGAPICNNCGQIGHTYYYCRNNPASRGSQGGRISRGRTQAPRGRYNQTRWQSEN